MNTNVKKLLLIFGGGFLLFWAFKKIKPIDVKKKNTSKKDTNASADGNSDDKMKNAQVCLKAYIEAKKAGESKDFLADMNREFIKEYGLKVMPNKSNGKLFVSDSEGNKVL
jgi:malate/lactate dehydrogenase